MTIITRPEIEKYNTTNSNQNSWIIIIIIKETLFVFWNEQLQISLRIGNLQMLLEIGLLKKTKQNKTRQKQKRKKEKKSKLH